ncbi:GNAT family N-acetyltransferase [Nocardioides zeae]|uniref:Ribosomal-protein-alanine N-acetyltransferase n=1 Tax=Nocardioides zeae TaxID=1457234 RepID=A0AAJ1U834_9ACTN|nr:GNAT family N-acetyltransferase [Nocardioides zeae]MDQ1105177.1 ribosomal-protein-alanine N-acetyltransferase [Nocardioides zeae]
MSDPTPPGPVLRPARTADVARVALLERDLFGPDAWSEEQVGAELSVPGRAMLVAEDPTDRSAVVGYAVLGVQGDVADLLRIGVDPTQRRTGIASALLAHLRGAARGAGADRMLLEVSDANTGAAAFYAARGFAEIHRRPRYYRDGSAALVLQLTL